MYISYFFYKRGSFQPDLNRWPLPYHGSTLPTELWKHKNGSEGRTRTYDRSVNSRLLYHWATSERSYYLKYKYNYNKYTLNFKLILGNFPMKYLEWQVIVNPLFYRINFLTFLFHRNASPYYFVHLYWELYIESEIFRSSYWNNFIFPISVKNKD